MLNSFRNQVFCAQKQREVIVPVTFAGQNSTFSGKNLVSLDCRLKGKLVTFECSFAFLRLFVGLGALALS
jgi:hypothetical protein